MVTSTARGLAALSTRLTVDRDFPTQIFVIALIMKRNRALEFCDGTLGIE